MKGNVEIYFYFQDLDHIVFFPRSEYEILSLGFFLFSCFDITRGGGGEGGGRRVGGGGQVGGGGEGKMLKEDIIKFQLDARKFLIEF